MNNDKLIIQVEKYLLRYNTGEKDIDANETEDGQVVLSGEGASGIQVIEVKIKYEGFDEFTDWGYTVRNLKFLHQHYISISFFMFFFTYSSSTLSSRIGHF